MREPASELKLAIQLEKRARARSRLGALIRSCVCFGCAIGLVNNCLGVFAVSVAGGLGVGIGEFSIMLTLVNIVSALFTLAVEWLMRRVPVRIVMGGGALVCAGAFVAMGSLSTLPEFYLAGACVGIGISCFSMLPVTYVLRTWYTDGNGLATGIAMGSSGMVGALANPLCGALIGTVGYQGGFRAIGILFLILAVPAGFSMSTGPEDAGRKGRQRADLEGRLAWRPVMMLSLLAACFALIGAFISHISVVGQDFGFTLQSSSMLASVIMISNILFKNAFGYLADRIGALRASALNTVICMLGGALLLSIGSFKPAAVLGSFMLGAAPSLFTVGITLIIQRVAGRFYMSVFPKVTAVVTFSLAIFIAAAGFLRDMSGSYAVMLTIVLAAGAIALCSLLSLQSSPDASS